jgi:hypothetical protein
LDTYRFGGIYPAYCRASVLPARTIASGGPVATNPASIFRKLFSLNYLTPWRQNETARRMQNSPGGRFFQRR